MKFVVFGFIFIVSASGCATSYDTHGKSFNSVLVTVSTENTIVAPPDYDTGTFVESIKQNILDLTTSNILKKGNLGIAQACAPGVLHAHSKIRSILARDVYETKRGNHTVARSEYNAFSIETTGVFIDCATGKEVGSFQHSEEGLNLLNNLQEISEDTAIDIYKQVVFGKS